MPEFNGAGCENNDPQFEDAVLFDCQTGCGETSQDPDFIMCNACGRRNTLEEHAELIVLAENQRWFELAAHMKNHPDLYEDTANYHGKLDTHTLLLFSKEYVDKREVEEYVLDKLKECKNRDDTLYAILRDMQWYLSELVTGINGNESSPAPEDIDEDGCCIDKYCAGGGYHCQKHS